MEPLTDQFKVLQIPTIENSCFYCESEGCLNCVYYGMPCANCRAYCIPWASHLSESEDESDDDQENIKIYPTPRSRTPEN